MYIYIFCTFGPEVHLPFVHYHRLLQHLLCELGDDEYMVVKNKGGGQLASYEASFMTAHSWPDYCLIIGEYSQWPSTKFPER